MMEKTCFPFWKNELLTKILSDKDNLQKNKSRQVQVLHVPEAETGNT